VTIAEEKVSTSTSISETSTDEHKDTLFEMLPLQTRVQSPLMAVKRSSMMRSFERRPEYNVYYPPASLQEILKRITCDHAGPSSPTSKEGEGDEQQRDCVCSVDELFELASVTLDYSNFYGYAPENELSRTMETGAEREDAEGGFIAPEVSAINSLQDSYDE